MKKNDILIFASDIGACTCLGIIIDYFVKTSFVFTVAGIAVGVVIAIINKKKNGEKKDVTEN